MYEKKDIMPRDDQGNPHGYWEIYYDNAKLWHKGNYKHGNKHGYWECYHNNGPLSCKGNYIYDQEDGLWVWGDYYGKIIQIQFYV